MSEIRTISEKHMTVLNFWFEDQCRNMRAAMRSAGYSENYSNHNYRAVFNKVEVKEEIEKRRAEITREHKIDMDWVIDRLVRIADTPAILVRFKKIDKDGSLYWDFSDASVDELAVINDLAVETYLTGRGETTLEVKKFKIGKSDSKGALDSLARILGGFNDSVTIKSEMSIIERLHAGRARVHKANKESMN